MTSFQYSESDVGGESSKSTRTTGLGMRVGGSGPRLALLHGFTQVSRNWDVFVEALVSNHQLLIPDMPGHGRSATVHTDLWETADLVGQACGPATYVGYSMGGRVALHLALRQPELVERLVLIGATAGLETAEEQQVRRLADEKLATHLVNIGVPAFLDEWMRNPLFATLSAEKAGGNWRSLNTAAGLASSLRMCGTGTQDSLWSRLSSIQCPTLIMAGSLDSKFLALGERLCASIGSNASLVAIPEAGHACHLEQPDAALNELRRFLDRNPAPEPNL